MNMAKVKGSKAKTLRVTAETHKELVRLSELEQRNIQDVTDRVLSAAVKAALVAAEANPPI